MVISLLLLWEDQEPILHLLEIVPNKLLHLLFLVLLNLLIINLYGPVYLFPLLLEVIVIKVNIIRLCLLWIMLYLYK